MQLLDRQVVAGKRLILLPVLAILVDESTAPGHPRRCRDRAGLTCGKRPLVCEYFLQRGQYIRKDLCIDRANPLDQSDLINSSDLIEHDQPLLR